MKLKGYQAISLAILGVIVTLFLGYKNAFASTSFFVHDYNFGGYLVTDNIPTVGSTYQTAGTSIDLCAFVSSNSTDIYGSNSGSTCHWFSNTAGFYSLPSWVTSTDGLYYMVQNYSWDGSGNGSIVMISISSGVVSFSSPFTPPTPIITHIEGITPASGATTSSTSVVASASYYLLNPDLGNYLTPPLVISLRLHRTDQIGTPDQKFDFDSLTYNALTAISHTFSLPTNSTWEMRFDLSGDGYYFISPLGTPTTFNVVTDPTTGTTGYTTCGITDLAGCFQNAIVFLFYPSNASVSQFSGLYLQFIHKPPFGYVSSFIGALTGLNDTGSSVFTLQSMEILNTMIFTPIYNAMIWILWVGASFMFFHRLKNLAL